MYNDKNNFKLVPTNDYVFKRIFGQVGNEDITSDLLEKILHKKYEKIDLSKNPIILADVLDGKAGVLDVVIKAEEKDNINIEMQVAKYEYMTERILEYWARKYSYEFKKGEDYGVAKRTVCILITCFEMKILKAIPKVHTKWNIREEEYTSIILTDKLEFHIISLDKLEKINKPKDREKELLNWCKFIQSPDEVEANIMEENEYIKKAKEELDKISQDEEERDLAYRRERAIRDQNAVRASGYNDGKEEGIKVGIKRGEKNKAIEIATNMLKEEIDLEIIIRITGLSKEEIKNIKISY